MSSAGDEELLRGAPVFPDTADHWASGYIALAVQLAAENGTTIGMPDGAFHPDEKVTPAQIVAFIMKFLGVRPMPLKEWPVGYLEVAAEQRMLDPEDLAWVSAEAHRPATRGEAFYLMDWTFYHYDVGAGMTFDTKYVDTTPPTLKLNPIAPESGSGKLTITGEVSGAIELYINKVPVPVDAYGFFTYDYDVEGKATYSITITARDLAGNTTEQSLTKHYPLGD